MLGYLLILLLIVPLTIQEYDNGERVYGELVISITKYPWMVSIRQNDDNGSRCSGIIIGNFYVLTAAHCVETGLPSTYSVYAGSVRFASGTKIEVDNIEVFGFYDGNMHDMALIKLKKAVSGIDGAAVIKIPDSVISFSAGGKMWTAGWGQGKPTSNTDILHEDEMKIVDDSICQNNFYGNYHAAFELCMQSTTMLRGVCKGDSGGGLYYQMNNMWYVVGIAIQIPKNADCHANNFPQKFLDITFQDYRQWITNCTENNYCSQPVKMNI
ncbi:unnamed protein product [Didymodactylos carnosus]|uniref:Peptidase S1 domain-containing protein n=1 Tax=Didymodactylos carnosus TaxID=1234261 RepID=A0A814Y7I2_9BILA|nr:unnamed protein product [Didymodactylos carnosus]CAF1388201.1 unnamed protein product [Didymodactylos carnosus]CAF3988477.1 unnamed protein product [Didymodactylos carnosus]CAF4196041.1 unnamed protein product [Didymodactylos carnosus]